ncbi:unnamed protein product [Chrysodeixis includens]|uniref:Uncharacterized protein n=1 Tax=Chrysodeixis includens TaxID=689277 RepID=A0A9N8KWI4_CHRIL|nr:unnamed protein product [Chrysodeixis includens]
MELEMRGCDAGLQQILTWLRAGRAYTGVEIAPRSTDIIVEKIREYIACVRVWRKTCVAVRARSHTAATRTAAPAARLLLTPGQMQKSRCLAAKLHSWGSLKSVRCSGANTTAPTGSQPRQSSVAAERVAGRDSCAQFTRRYTRLTCAVNISAAVSLTPVNNR